MQHTDNNNENESDVENRIREKLQNVSIKLENEGFFDKEPEVESNNETDNK